MRPQCGFALCRSIYSCLSLFIAARSIFRGAVRQWSWTQSNISVSGIGLTRKFGAGCWWYLGVTQEDRTGCWCSNGKRPRRGAPVGWRPRLPQIVLLFRCTVSPWSHYYSLSWASVMKQVKLYEPLEKASIKTWKGFNQNLKMLIKTWKASINTLNGSTRSQSTTHSF